MNSRIKLFACVGALGLFLALFPGCYTQMGASKSEDERGEGYGYNNQGGYQDSTYNQSEGRYDSDYYDNYAGRPYYSFNYYYPPYSSPAYMFNAAYYDPWAFNFGFNYGYSPYSYYNSYYSPYYPTGYYTGYYPYYGYGAVGPYGVRALRRGSRTFGDTRGAASGGVMGGGRGVTTSADPNINASAPPPVVNVDRGGYSLPSGMRTVTPTTGAVHTSAPATVNHNPAPPRGDASVRGGVRTRSGHAVRGWGQRRGGSAPSGRINAAPRDENPPPAPQGSPRSSGGRDAGVQRSAPAPAPRPEAPSGGRSGGSTRGGRP